MIKTIKRVLLVSFLALACIGSMFVNNVLDVSMKEIASSSSEVVGNLTDNSTITKENPWSDPLNPPSDQRFSEILKEAMRADLRSNGFSEKEINKWVN